MEDQMNEIEYLIGDEQDEEKTDRELSEEELAAVAGGRAGMRSVIDADASAAAEAAANVAADADANADLDADSSAASLKDSQ
jgi:hypothetical protein